MHGKKTGFVTTAAAVAVCALGLAQRADVQAANASKAEDAIKPMYRLYNKNSGEHFYTSSVGEKNAVVKAGWKDEGIGCCCRKTVNIRRKTAKTAYLTQEVYWR